MNGTPIRCTLVAEGPTDSALIAPLDWLLNELAIAHESISFADFRHLSSSLQPHTLAPKIALAVELYPCDLLFVHRDADRVQRATRAQEIHQAAAKIEHHPPYVCVVPVRMTEAWLLFDEPAIRLAADNPNGRVPLMLPSLAMVERIPDPKQLLFELLRTASNLNGRRLKSFRPEEAAHRVAEYIETFVPLRNISAFAALESELRAIAEHQHWLAQS